MIKDAIIKKKPCNVFFQIFSNNKPEMGLSITRKTGITHSHVWELIGIFHKYGLVAKEKNGRVIMLTLTKKGLKIGTELKAIHKLLDGVDKKCIKQTH